MELTLLGKPLEDHPLTDYYEKELMEYRFYKEFGEHNKSAFISRFSQNPDKEALDWFVMDGNSFKTTDEIIAAVRVTKTLGLLSDEQWQRAIPVIERGLEANKAYVHMLDEMAPIFERYCDEWEDVGMHYTFGKRIGLELWQGRFNRGL